MLDSKPNFYRPLSPVMKLDPKAPHRSRLERLRRSHGNMSQADMARKLGVSFERYNNIERGMPLSHDMAMRMVRAFPGLSLDWLHMGRREGLSRQMDDRLYPVPRRPNRTTDAP